MIGQVQTVEHGSPHASFTGWGPSPVEFSTTLTCE